MTSDDTAILPTYKQTELGHVPAAWEVKALRDFAHIETGSTPPTVDPENYGDEHFFVSPGDMGGAKWITRTEKRLSAKGFAASRRFPQGSVLFVCIGSTIGKCGVASTELTSNQQINAVLPGCDFSSDFLYYALSAATPRVRALAGEQAVPMVNKSGFAETKVALPPVEEQRAIAEALSDTDAVIEGLDRLIAKKRDLKQAAMQRLLTGHIRLPGFLGTWDRVELGDVAGIRNTKVIAASMPSDTPCVELESLSQGGGRLLGWTESRVASTKYRFETGDVLFGRLRAYLRKYWFATFDGICSTEIWPLVAHDERLTAEFLHLLVQTDEFVEAAGISYGTHMPRSDWSVLRKFDVMLPPPDEQAAIADVISSIDAELQLLEARRDKTRALKQAMMQDLLTGRIRLI